MRNDNNNFDIVLTDNSSFNELDGIEGFHPSSEVDENELSNGAKEIYRIVSKKYDYLR